MRIIGGRLKGRRLAAVRGTIRPTSDMVREAIFNILGPACQDVLVLDLFAGTGALGLEALSRGARGAVFVENHPSGLQVLQRNLRQCQLVEASQVLPLPAARAVDKLAARGRQFGLIFLDPPYGQGLAAAILPRLARNNLLTAQGLIIAEHNREEDLLDAYPPLVRRDQRHYGATLVSIYASRPGQTGENLSRQD